MNPSEIEKRVKDFADARSDLMYRAGEFEGKLLTVKKRYLPVIRRAAERAKEKQDALRAAIEAAPELFQKPKTLTLFGIRFGFMKQKGTITWEDESAVIKLLKKHFPDAWQTYVKATERVIKPALETLPVGVLKKIGVEATETGEAVIIKPVDSEVDKLVDALLKEEETKDENHRRT